MGAPGEQSQDPGEQDLRDKLAIENPPAQGDEVWAPGKAADDILKRKSRAAQKRYRARVKAQKEGIEKQVAVLLRRIAELKRIQASLKTRNRSLKRFEELSEGEDREEGTTSQQDASLDNRDVKEWHRLYVAGVNRVRGPAGPQMTLEECMAIYPDSGRFVALVNEVYMQLFRAMGFTLTPEASGEAAATEFILQMRKDRAVLSDHMQIARKHSTAEGVPDFFLRQVIRPSALAASIRALHLSCEQRKIIYEAKACFLEDSAKIRVQRKSILKRLRQSNAPQKSATASEVTLYDRMYSAQDAQDQLQESLAIEAATMRQFAVACVEAITPLQEAKVIIAAYIQHGLLVDSWDIANALITEVSIGSQLGDTQAQQEGLLVKCADLLAELPGHESSGV